MSSWKQQQRREWLRDKNRRRTEVSVLLNRIAKEVAFLYIQETFCVVKNWVVGLFAI
jgi:hypothetical protein